MQRSLPIVSKNASLVFKFLFVFFAVLNTYARTGDADESCTSFRMDENGGSMQHVPVTDQEGLATCYAHVASQLADAYEKTHLGEKILNDPALKEALFKSETSSFAAAVYNKAARFEKDGLENDWDACETIRSLTRNGSCLKSDVDDSLAAAYVTQTPTRRLETYHFISSLWKYYRKWEEKPFECQNANDWANPDEAPLAFLKPAFSNLPAPRCQDLQQVLQKVAWKHPFWIVPARFVRPFIDPLCLKKRPNLALQSAACFSVPYDQFESHDADLLKKINQLIDRPLPQPIAVGMCAEVFMSGRDYVHPGFKKTDQNLLRHRVTSQCLGHAALIIGRRPFQGHCQFLLRNSSGLTSCPTYMHKDWECDGGNVWIDSEAVIQNADRLDYIDSSPEKEASSF